MEVSPNKPTVHGPDRWFTGEVWIDAVAEGHGASPMTVGSVRFTPGAHTAWHRHSIGQTLQVTDGVGRVQSRGEHVVTIRPGDVVCPPRRVALARRRSGPVHDAPVRHRGRHRMGQPCHRRRVPGRVTATGGPSVAMWQRGMAGADPAGREQPLSVPNAIGLAGECCEPLVRAV